MDVLKSPSSLGFLQCSDGALGSVEMYVVVVRFWNRRELSKHTKVLAGFVGERSVAVSEETNSGARR